MTQHAKTFRYLVPRSRIVIYKGFPWAPYPHSPEKQLDTGHEPLVRIQVEDLKIKPTIQTRTAQQCLAKRQKFPSLPGSEFPSLASSAVPVGARGVRAVPARGEHVAQTRRAP